MNFKSCLQTTSAGTPAQEDIQKVLALEKEFRFAVDCMQCLLRDSSIRWIPRADSSPPEPYLCSPNIVKAIHNLISLEIESAIQVIFDSWFSDGTQPTFPRFKQLLDMIVTNFCDSPITIRKFLELCCTVGEISAIMYMSNLHKAPDYGMLCIFFCTIHTIEKIPEIAGQGPFQALENLARRINENHMLDGDPTSKMRRNRQKILSEFLVT